MKTMTPRLATRAGATLLVLAGIASPTNLLAAPTTTNLAVGGTATATGADYGAAIEDAIDGDRNGDFGAGSVFYGNAIAENPPLFYQVDLGASAYIERVQLLRRTDAQQGVFGNMRLTIYEDDGAGAPGAVAFTQDYLTNGFTIGSWGTTDPGASAPGGAFGRHVRLERLDNNYWLTFAEFEVIGSGTPLLYTEADNLVVGKPVTTLSGPGYGAQLTSANDGGINGDFNFGDRSVYHSTNFGVGEFWQVDLGETTPLEFAELFVRSDEQTTSQFKVAVLDESLAEVGSVIVDNNGPMGATPDYDLTVDLSGLTGRYLRVETTRDEYLAFTELRAFAPAVPEPTAVLLIGAGLLGVAVRRPLA
ncbi:PEP-CTERM sorting domain-containing protein [Botrimarina mediterranea]|uniref:PEP-CTERM sorting domain-containing protein n=1 Tax=Botrimarina mediterranea TaxID=2528022 RepID=UPI00118ACAF5|nr:F5/8 type C domain protein [Planctomycetes bacterium K2D]